MNRSSQIELTALCLPGAIKANRFPFVIKCGAILNKLRYSAIGKVKTRLLSRPTSKKESEIDGYLNIRVRKWRLYGFRQ